MTDFSNIVALRQEADGLQQPAHVAPAPMLTEERRILRTIQHSAGKGWEKIEVMDAPPRRRTISGTACTGYAVHGTHSFDPWGCVLELPCPVLYSHAQDDAGKRCKVDFDDIAIGEVVQLLKTREALFVTAAIFESRAGNLAWDLIRRGRARAFSISAIRSRTAGLVDGVTFVNRWHMSEVSVCRNGADPGAQFRIAHDENGVVWP